MKRRAPTDKDLIWVLSSGTQSVNEVKAIGLTREALLASARAVNAHLKSTKSDRWLLNLPTYHVGGLGILARAHLSGAKVSVQNKWNPKEFVALAGRDRITLCSLVPTQVYDLVTSGLRSPEPVRAIVVGGGALDPAVYRKGRELGWPLLPSYGLTESASQVATADLGSLRKTDYPDLTVLPHAGIELRKQRIFVRAKSVCRYVARASTDGWFSLEDPLRGGWLPTEDLGKWKDNRLKVLGRRDEVVKILGALVPVPQVEHEVRAYFGERGLTGDLTVLAVPGGRAGHDLILVFASKQSLKLWEESFNAYDAGASGPHRLKQFCWVPAIPRGELGKVKRAALLAQLRLC